MAKVKYSEFVEALGAAAALDGTESVVVLQDGTPVETTTQDIADLGGGGSSYLVYRALLSQAGTDAPVATVLENTLGGTVVWTRDGVGDYSATLTGAFTANKTFGLVNADYSAGSTPLLSLVRSTSDACRLVSFLADGSFADIDDGGTGAAPIQIFVYP